MKWLCRTCDDQVTETLPGNEPGELRCFECDSIVEYVPILSKAEREGTPESKLAKKKVLVNPFRKSLKQTKVEHDGGRGRRALERIQARERGESVPPIRGESVSKKTKPKKERTKKPSAKDEPEEKNLGRTTGRHGKCGRCKEKKWLLSKNPPLCTICWRIECPEAYEASLKKQRESKKRNAEAKKRYAERVAAKASKPSPEPSASSPDPSPEPVSATAQQAPTKPEPMDDLDREIKAIASCARALEGLSPDAAERVLRYAAARYGASLGVQPAIAFDTAPAANGRLARLTN